MVTANDFAKRILITFFSCLILFALNSCGDDSKDLGGGETIAIENSEITLEVGSSRRLEANILPADAPNTAHVWASESPEVATVDETGLVTAHSVGNAKIVARLLSNNSTAVCEVKVVNKIIYPEIIGLSSTEEFLLVGEELTLTVNIYPETANDRSITWTSGNTEVATVNEEGVVKAISNGVTEITATTTNNKTAKCKLTVGNEGVDFSDIYASVQDDSSVRIGCTLHPKGVTVTEAGICIDPNKTPNLSSSVYKSTSTSQVSATITKLQPNTRYFYRIYAKAGEEVYYSATASFTTQGSIVTNFNIKEIWLDKLVFETPVIPGVDLKVCYGIAPNPEITDNLAQVALVDNRYEITLKNLSKRQMYYVRAYTIINGKAIYYDNEGNAATLGYKGQIIQDGSATRLKNEQNTYYFNVTTDLPSGTYRVYNNKDYGKLSQNFPSSYYDAEKFIYIKGGQSQFYVVQYDYNVNNQWIYVDLDFENIETGVKYRFINSRGFLI